MKYKNYTETIDTLKKSILSTRTIPRFRSSLCDVLDHIKIELDKVMDYPFLSDFSDKDANQKMISDVKYMTDTLDLLTSGGMHLTYVASDVFGDVYTSSKGNSPMMHDINGCLNRIRWRKGIVLDMFKGDLPDVQNIFYREESFSKKPRIISMISDLQNRARNNTMREEYPLLCAETRDVIDYWTLPEIDTLKERTENFKTYNSKK